MKDNPDASTAPAAGAEPPSAASGRPGRKRRARAAAGRLALVAAAAAVGSVAACSSPAPAPGSSQDGQSTVSSAAASSPSASQSGASPAKLTSCNVITQAEASAALGQQVQPPIKGKAVVEGGVACVFDGPNVPPGASPDIPYGDTVRVVLVTGAKAKKYFNDYRSKVSAQPISGLGDAAYYDGYASISVLKGDAYVRIAVGIANNLGPEKMLAGDALTRM